MIFYEIELLSIPKITLACSADYEAADYGHTFHHPQNFIEIALIEEGRLLIEHTNGQKSTVEPKMLSPIFCDADFKCKTYPKEKQRHTTVLLSAEYRMTRYESEKECDLRALTERMKQSGILLIPYQFQTGEYYEEILYMLKKIAIHTNAQAPCAPTLALSEFFKLVSLLSNIVYNKLIESQLSVSPSELVYVNKAADFMAAHYAKKLTVADIAKHLRISEGYLHRIFKKVKGMGITEHLNRHRISVAIMLMTDRGLSLKEAALNVGIEDQAYMSRLFKKVTGMTCRTYLAEQRKKIHKTNRI